MTESAAVGIRGRMRGTALKRETVTLDMGGDQEPLIVDVHEIPSGERMDLADLARKVNEGKIQGGSKVFARKLLMRTVHVVGTDIRVWSGAKESKKEEEAEIDAMAPSISEPILKMALKINAMDQGASTRAKNASVEAEPSSISSDETPDS